VVALIFRERSIKPDNVIEDFSLKINNNSIYKDAIFFDLEHYVYKKPVCIGVFGCCYYDEESNLI